MKEKKRKKHLKKLLKKVKKKIESSLSSDNPINGVKLRICLVSIIMNFCGVSNDESYHMPLIPIFPSSYYDFADKLIHRVKPLLDVKIRNKLNMDKCSICGRFLDEPNAFLENPPDKYKICCYCLKTAKFIYSDLKEVYDKSSINSIFDGASHLRKNYKKYHDKFDSLFIIKKKGGLISV